MKVVKFSLMAVLALGALLACANLASAQDAKEEKGKKRAATVDQQVQRMDQELKLTDEQKTKLKAALEEGNKKRQQLFQESRDANAPREDRRDKMQALMKEQNEKIKAILTAEQWQKWEKARQEMRKNTRQGNKKRSVEP